jgi:hypothetical protein
MTEIKNLHPFPMKVRQTVLTVSVENVTKDYTSCAEESQENGEEQFPQHDRGGEDCPGVPGKRETQRALRSQRDTEERLI